MGLDQVGVSMSFGEALLLTSVLAGDPSSQVAASLVDWAHPVSREDITLRDLFDLTYKAHSQKRNLKPYPRPWDARPTRTGGGTSMSVAQFKALKASIANPPNDVVSQ